jgi:hypothetical protein
MPYRPLCRSVAAIHLFDTKPGDGTAFGSLPADTSRVLPSSQDAGMIAFTAIY